MCKKEGSVWYLHRNFLKKKWLEKISSLLQSVSSFLALAYIVHFP